MLSKIGAMLLLPGLLAAGCFRSSAPRGGGAEAIDPGLARQGAGYYSDWGCDACHGDAGRGTDDAPSLAGLGDRWTIDELALYLFDPESYGAGNARVRELQDRYPDVEMPGFELPADQLRAMSAWLLTLDREE